MSKPASIPPDSQPTSYTIPELAKLCGMTRWRCQRYLEGKGVELHSVRTGGDRQRYRRIVWLAEVADKAPELLRSIRYARHIDRVNKAEA